tara:strand:- start:158 stop:814 length:657 start_codon:yes stop_codon:yes gene_type:complete
MNIDDARKNMVDCQIKTWDVFDLDVLDAFEKVKRENFVPSAYHELAFADINLDIGDSQKMMSPKVEARILQALALRKEDKVLEIGSGSGHMTALLAVLSKDVISFECRKNLFETARSNLKKAAIDNVRIYHGDGLTEYKQFAPYDVIVLSGATPNRQRIIEKSLAIGGRMFTIVGSGDVMEAKLVQRISESNWHLENLFETSAEILKGSELQPVFQFD